MKGSSKWYMYGSCDAGVMSLQRLLVLGKNLNRWGQWKTSVVLVALLVVIS